MRFNKMKSKLANGEPALGVTLQEVSLQSAEILGLLGFDYINIDCLHSSLNVESVVPMVLAAELRGITTLVRVPENRAEVILPYLDAGVHGIIVAEMDNAETARRLVDAVKFEPEGKRSLASVHASDFGLTEPLAKYAVSANCETMAIGIVESAIGIDNIEEILSTQGLDAVIIGTTDLSKALGVTGQTDHPLMQDAMNKILAVGKKTGKTIGITLKNGEDPKSMINKGFGIIGVHLKALLISAAKKHLSDARG